MRMSPIALGTEAVPTLNLFRNGTMPGKQVACTDPDSHGQKNPER